MKKTVMNILFLLIPSLIIMMDLNSQVINDNNKYKVYSDVINQIQEREAIRLYKKRYYKDTIEFKPVIIKKHTRYYTNSIGIFLKKNIDSGKSAFEGSEYLRYELEFFMNIQDKKLICLDTGLIELQAKFDTLSSHEIKLFKEFHLNSKVRLKTAPKIKILGLFNRTRTLYWKIFYLRYPKCFGIFEFSDIVFSNNNKYAILYAGYQRQSLAGYGSIYYLENKDGIWVIKKTMGIWES